jgi:protein involved in polysaccharide export with SLBB domain
VRDRALLLIVLACALMAGLCFGQAKRAIKPGDQVSVVCEEEPSLSKDYTVTRDGYIVLQFVGAVNIGGLSEAAAAAKIAQALVSERILTKATVRLNLTARKDQTISYAGAVGRSGELLPRDGLRLSDVVNAAKPTAAADMERILITTGEGKEIWVNFKAFDGKDQRHNPEVRAGDHVFFTLLDRPTEVTVVGMVAKPGPVEHKKGMTVKGAIEAAGGLTALADQDAIRIERDRVPLPPMNLLEAGRTEVKLGDVIRVAQAPATRQVTVMGAVASPKKVAFREGMTVGGAIKEAGGPLGNANLGSIKITRLENGKQRTFTHDLTAVGKGMSGDLPLKVNDVIDVPEGKGRRSMSPAMKIAGALLLIFGITRF